MSLPYFPLYPRDYDADTAHLTLAEDGAYSRLLRLCWTAPGCSIPHDEAWICRRLRVSKSEFKRSVAPVIEEFFTAENGRIFNRRLRKEHLRANESHNRRVSAGKKGRKNQLLENKGNRIEQCPSNAIAMPGQPEPEPEPEDFSCQGMDPRYGLRDAGAITRAGAGAPPIDYPTDPTVIPIRGTVR